MFGRLAPNCAAAERLFASSSHLQKGRVRAAASNRALLIRLYSRQPLAVHLLPLLQLPFLAPRLADLPMTGVMSKTNGTALRGRTHSTKSTPKTKGQAVADPNSHEEEHDHDHDHEHSHSHSIFGHTHSREDGPSKEVESVVQVFQGKADRGSRITVIGLVVNVGLTISKFGAGWMMNSAALLAEAGHSASDLLGDFVTLFAWRFSKRSPTDVYPYGFGKFETLGTTTLALILIGGAFGIGFHSFNLLTHHLLETASTLPPGAAQQIVQNVTAAVQSVSSAATTHGLHDAHVHALDPNAAWFAAISVVAKEWLYRATKTVADEERSKVLLANAVHHRSDAYTSMVALCAILGTWWFPALPLDPLGGILVSLVILRQGISLFSGAFGELTDAGVSQRTRRSLLRSLEPLTYNSASPLSDPALLRISDLRAMRSGALMFVDVSIRVPPSLPVSEAVALENKIHELLMKARREISEVRVKFIPNDDTEENEEEEEHEDELEKESKNNS